VRRSASRKEGGGRHGAATGRKLRNLCAAWGVGLALSRFRGPEWKERPVGCEGGVQRCATAGVPARRLSTPKPNKLADPRMRVPGGILPRFTAALAKDFSMLARRLAGLLVTTTSYNRDKRGGLYFHVRGEIL